MHLKSRISDLEQIVSSHSKLLASKAITDKGREKEIIILTKTVEVLKIFIQMLSTSLMQN